MRLPTFIRKVFLFLIFPVCILVVIEFLLPLNFFTFRVYEAIKFNNESIPHIGPFYPNKTLFMKSVGDLCSHTSSEVVKDELWKTDKLGFRNSFFSKQPEVVVFGSSFIYGTGLSQEHTFTEQLSRKLHQKVYNFSPYSINDFEMLVQKDSLTYPKIIVFSIGDWYVPTTYKEQIKSFENKFVVIIKDLFYNFIGEVVDRCTRFFSYHWLKSKFIKKGVNYQSSVYPSMFFGKGENYKPIDSSELMLVLKNVLQLEDYCKKRNIKLYYVFTPSKEFVYSDFIPQLSKYDYYSVLANELHKNGISGVNSLEIFNDYRKKSSKLLYHTDDTHWNKLGVDLITTELSTKILSTKHKN